MSRSITFTFLLDISGGTYISQFSGLSKEEASMSWANSVDKDIVAAFNGAKADEIGEEVVHRIKEDGLIAITNVLNVWFLYISVKDVSGYLNIVQTQT